MHRKHQKKAIALIAAIISLGGCSDDAIDCSAIGAPSAPTFMVTIVDTSGAPAWFGAVATIQDGAFHEVLIPLSQDPADSVRNILLVAQSHREGLYTVRVEKSGFTAWAQGGFEVVREGCFLTSHNLEVELQPSP